MPGDDSLPTWQGFHHIALATPDFDGTIAFYGEVLGMQVGETLTMGMMKARHCFISPGGESFGLHFFEVSGAEIHQYPERLSRAAFIPGALQHIAFALPDASEGVRLRERLASRGISTTPTGTLGPIQNMLFFDNNGILLEATWPNPAIDQGAD